MTDPEPSDPTMSDEEAAAERAFQKSIKPTDTAAEAARRLKPKTEE